VHGRSTARAEPARPAPEGRPAAGR